MEQNYRVGIYCRLSKNDDNPGESTCRIHIITHIRKMSILYTMVFTKKNSLCEISTEGVLLAL